MKILIACLVLIGFSFPSFSKESIDKLTAQLSVHQAADTVRVNLLNKLGYEYWIVDPVKSEDFGKQAIQLATSLAYKPGMAFGNRIVGVSHWARGQYPEALQYLISGLTIYEKLKDWKGVASMYNNIGLVYHDQRNYTQALKYFEQALAMAKTTGYKKLQIITLDNLGNTYFQMKQYAKAETLYLQHLQLSKTENLTYSIAVSYSNLGQLHLERNNVETALAYFLQSTEIRSAIEDREGIAMCHYYIGKAYLAKKKYAEAEQYLLKGIDISRQVNTLRWLTSIYETLKDLEKQRGNYQQATAYFEEFMTKKDSLFNLEKSRQIAEMQTKYETLQKEQKLKAQQQELALLKEHNRFQKLLKNGLLMGMGAIAVITYLIISRQRLRIRKNKELLIKNQEIYQTEQALAKAQLENARLQELKLIEELEVKNKKLTSYSLNFIQKNELMEEVKLNLNQLKKSKNTENTRELNGLSRLMEQSVQIDKDWEDFQRNFGEVHKDFYRILKAYYPDLTNHELKLCTLLKLNMNLKEAANIMGISPESVKKARYRLRKKFNLSREENLIDHIIHLEKQANVETMNVA
ncbi:tetratricopeptide repeat protein [Rhodocytophaga aerolata]|uniref:Tetratricopeptide repeat protein n=1 Tax=Rhodocytophaga aerolata TaxID=455078 RepID=A0ABT8RBV9_9BACT|nr:tetratricopeptide repeat protein [Rhodocytophaga aerolata]MDO1448242.1 tetratricopeptide repeat protein [Rhodocytophaga aerolata]